MSSINDRLDNLEEKFGLEEKKKKKIKKPYSSETITTGDPFLNDKFFNAHMGTDFESAPEAAESNGDGMLVEKTERYINRYYVRPQNIFCSSKSDILRVLAKLGHENCTIYSLKNLSNHDDVQKLTNNDIIYYYDDGVLYDKNNAQVFDYELRPKDEEKRELADNPSDDGGADQNKELHDIYFDDKRMTSVTANKNSTIKVKENLEHEFNQEFDDVNVFGECLTEKLSNVCSICGEEIGENDESFDASVIGKKSKCCKACYVKFVEPVKDFEEEKTELKEEFKELTFKNLTPSKLDPTEEIVDRVVESWKNFNEHKHDPSWQKRNFMLMPIGLSLSVSRNQRFNKNPNKYDALQAFIVCVMLKYQEILTDDLLFTTLKYYGIPKSTLKECYDNYWKKNFAKYKALIENAIQKYNAKQNA